MLSYSGKEWSSLLGADARGGNRPFNKISRGELEVKTLSIEEKLNQNLHNLWQNYYQDDNNALIRYFMGQ